MLIELIITAGCIIIMVKFIPSFKLISRFTYPNAKFSAIATTFIKEKELSKLLESKNLEDLKNGVISKDFVLNGDTVRDIQKNIEKSIIKVIAMAKNDSPRHVKRFYDMYLEKIEGDSLKKAIRKIKEEKEIGEVYASGEQMKNLIEMLKDKDKESAEIVLKDHGFIIDLDRPLVEIEREIDKKIIEKLLSVKLPDSCRRVRDKFVKIMIDIINIKTILRGTHFEFDVEEKLIANGWELPEWLMKELIKIDSIPEIISMLEGTSYMPYLRQSITSYEKEGIGALEIALDKYLIKASRDIANEKPLGFGPGLRFITEKEFEAKNLIAVTKAIEEEMQKEAWKVLVVE